MILFAVLFLLWVVLNGRITLEICLFGLGLSAALTWFSRKFLGYGEGRRHRSLKYYALLLQYGAVLLVEVVKANLCVFRIAAARRLNFQPALVYFDTDLKEESSRVILANSITLTPGTITVLLDQGRYCVHCLDKSLAKGIDESVFVRLLRRIEEA